jgi:hypothetical protein
MLALAAAGAAIVGCEPSPGSSVDSGYEDSGYEEDSGDGGDTGAEQDAPFDAEAEASPADAAIADSQATDAGSDSSAADDATQPPAEGAATVGTLVVTADASLTTTSVGGACAAANSLVVTPAETEVGDMIALTASGIDPDNRTSDVTLRWTAAGDAGMLSDTTGTTNAFQCQAVGNEVVTVTASISDGGASCGTNGSLTAMLTCAAP